MADLYRDLYSEDGSAPLVHLVYMGGTTTEGVVLASFGGTIRVAVKGAGDVEEFRRLSDMWVSEASEPVMIHDLFGMIPNAALPVNLCDLGPSETALRVAGWARSSAYVD
jgi:hypothetical protein